MHPVIVRTLAARLIGVVTSVITAIAIYKVKEKLDERKYGNNRKTRN
ncbi:MAG: hypothetical protein MJ244_05155 [Clostridia bacterium]|nr:hypothetical protein [Clostridia bacterium]